MGEAIRITEAEVSRFEDRQMEIDGKLAGVLSVVMEQSDKSEEIEEGNTVEFRGRRHKVYRKEIPSNVSHPIVYLTLMDIGSIVQQ